MGSNLKLAQSFLSPFCSSLAHVPDSWAGWCAPGHAGPQRQCKTRARSWTQKLSTACTVLQKKLVQVYCVFLDANCLLLFLEQKYNGFRVATRCVHTTTCINAFLLLQVFCVKIVVYPLLFIHYLHPTTEQGLSFTRNVFALLILIPVKMSKLVETSIVHSRQ